MGLFRYLVRGDPSQLQTQRSPEHNTHSLLNSLFYGNWKAWSLWDSCSRVLELLLSSFVLNGLIENVFIDHNHLNNRWNKGPKTNLNSGAPDVLLCLVHAHRTSATPAFPVTISNHMWACQAHRNGLVHHRTCCVGATPSHCWANSFDRWVYGRSGASTVSHPKTSTLSNRSGDPSIANWIGLVR